MADEHPAFQFKKNKADETYFNIVAANGQVLATSEGYSSERAARNGAQSVIANVCMDCGPDEAAGTVPPRTNIAVRLNTLKKLGIETMHDVALAVQDGRLQIIEETQ